MRFFLKLLRNIGKVYGYDVKPEVLWGKNYLKVLPHKVKEVQRILIFDHHGIGDVVMSFPLLKLLRKTFPSSELIITVASSVHQQAIEAIGLPKVKFLPLSLSKMSIKEILNFVFGLRRAKIEIGVATYGINSIASKLLMMLCGIKVGFGFTKLALKAHPSNTYPSKDDVSDNPWKYHKVYQNFYLAMLVAHSSGYTVSGYPDMNWPVGDEDFHKAEEILRDYGIEPEKDIVIGIHCGGAPSSLSKVWPLERFSALIKKLKQDRNWEIVLFGGPDEVEHARQLEHSLCSIRVINLVGKTNLKELAALIKHCRVMVGCDTGVMHIASAVGTPSVLIFSNYTDPYITAPFNPSANIIIKAKPCPFHKGVIGCVKEFPSCLNTITVEEVYRGIIDLLSKGTPLNSD